MGGLRIGNRTNDVFAMKHIVFTIITLLLAVACNKTDGQHRILTEIAEMVSDNPRGAISRLDSIDVSTLSEADRHFRDLLAIKAADKAYVIHRSDSLVLDVIDWYGSHRKFGLYPEALYYGGRVYSDLGDYPTALAYFHNAHDKLPDDDDYIVLRGNIVSQTGRLLDDLRLYKEAIPYIKESIEICKKQKDIYNLAYDNQLLSGIYLHSGNLDSAMICINDAIHYSASLSNIDKADIRISLVNILRAKGDIESALHEIRPLVNSVDSICRNYALITAARIYSKVGIQDTAYMYAYELAKSKNPNNRKNGFQILFSPELKSIVPKDTLLANITGYHKSIENFLNTRESQLVLVQQSKYNYDRHLADRIKAETRFTNTLILLFVILIITMAIIFIVINQRKRNTILKLKLEKALTLLGKESSDCSEEDSEQKNQKSKSSPNKEFHIPDEIFNSEVYRELMAGVDSNTGYDNNDDIWKKLDTLILSLYPDFTTNLRKATHGRMTDVDLQTALLIRCGITPSQMAILINRSKTAASSRRTNLSVKIFGKGATSKMLDEVIFSL